MENKNYNTDPNQRHFQGSSRFFKEMATLIYHENVRLLLVTLNKHVKTIPTEFRSFIELINCDQNSKDCMLGACSKCPAFDALKPKESINGITWWQWNSNENSRVEKLEFTGEIADCFEQLKKLYLYFLRHTYIERKQFFPRDI